MATSVISVVGVTSPKFPARFQHRSSSTDTAKLSYPFRMFESRKLTVAKRSHTCLSGAGGDRLATDTADKGSENDEKSLSNNISPVNSPSLDLDSAARNSLLQTNGSTVSSLKQEAPASPSTQSAPKKSMLTARERLRAARVLSRYTETKESKSQLGRNVLDALRESDRGKRRSGLPEAPTNMLDDSKRGMPKKGLTFDFPGGFDLFLIVFSFVFISTVMFATTFIVWKVGAIHFNEY